MKILFVIHPFHEAPYKYRESNGITLTTLKKILEKRGHEVEIFETRNNFPTKKGDYDIIHGFSNSAIRVLRTKYLGFMNSAAKVHSMRGISSSRIGGLRFSEFFRFVDHLIVPSEDIKKKIAGKRLNTPIDVIPSSIDTSKFQPLKVEKFKIPTLLYYGKVFDKTDSRGIKNIIDTAKKMPTIDFLIMPRGDKNIDKLDKNYLKKINKSDNIKILRAEEGKNLPELINKSWFCFFPYNSFKDVALPPCVVLESIACKTPVITTYIPEDKRLNDAIINIGEDIAKDISRALRKDINMEKPYKAIKDYDHEIATDKMEDVYKDVLEKDTL